MRTSPRRSCRTRPHWCRRSTRSACTSPARVQARRSRTHGSSARNTVALRDLAPSRGFMLIAGEDGKSGARPARDVASALGLDMTAVRIGHLEGTRSTRAAPRFASEALGRTERDPPSWPDRAVAWRAQVAAETRAASSTALCDASWPSDARVHRRPCSPRHAGVPRGHAGRGVSDVDEFRSRSGARKPTSSSSTDTGSPPRSCRLGAGDLVRIRSAGPRARPPPERSSRRAARTHQQTDSVPSQSSRSRTSKERSTRWPTPSMSSSSMASACSRTSAAYLGEPCVRRDLREAEQRRDSHLHPPVAPVGYERFAVGYAAPALEYPFETTRCSSISLRPGRCVAIRR